MRSSDEERGTETLRTSTRSPNDRRTTNRDYSTQNGTAKLATVEDEVGDLREIFLKVQEELARTKVSKTLSSVATIPYRFIKMIKSLLISKIHRVFIQGTTLLARCEWTLEFLELW